MTLATLLGFAEVQLLLLDEEGRPVLLHVTVPKAGSRNLHVRLLLAAKFLAPSTDCWLTQTRHCTYTPHSPNLQQPHLRCHCPIQTLCTLVREKPLRKF